MYSNYQPNEREELFFPLSLPIIRVSIVHEKTLELKPIENYLSLVVIAQAILGDKDREYFVGILLDVKNCPLAIHVISIGTVAESIAHPREVFKEAIVYGASGIVLIHNHPHGDPNPSSSDTQRTKQLVEAGKIIGIPIVDHLIIGNGTSKHYSFRNNGFKF